MVGTYLHAGEVSAAFLHALLTDEVFAIPPVVYYPNGGVLWNLWKAMYGLKQSPRMWQQHFASVAASLGFERLKSDSNLYFQPRCYMLWYVDDLVIVGDKRSTEFLFSELQKQLRLRSEGVLEPGASISFLLGRCITRREDSIEMSMPTSYIDKTLEQLDMLTCRHAATPGTDSLRKLIDSDILSPEGKRSYRRIVGQLLLLWLSSIRPDIQFAVKELSRGSTSPTEDLRTKMKTLLRYLAGTKPMVLTLRPKIIPHSKQTTFDTDAY